MLESLMWVGVGLLIGWFLLPAPLMVTNLWKRLFGQKELH